MLQSQNKVFQIYPSCKPQIPVQSKLLKEQEDDLPTKTFFSKYPGIIGIEIEVEGITKKYPNEHSLWSYTKDDSLKDHGLEIISKPIQGKLIDIALKQAKDFLNLNPHHYFSHRCSIHVHINVSNNTVLELMKFVNLLLLLEAYLTEFVEEKRRHNNFCIPLRDVELTPAKILSFSMNTKYLSIAFNHLKDYGTVEFRTLEGTNDFVKLRRWIMIIQKIYLYAISHDLVNVNSIKEIEPLAVIVFNTIRTKIPNPDSIVLDDCFNAYSLFNSKLKEEL